MEPLPKKIVLATGIFPPEEGGPATYSKLLQKDMPAYGFSVEVYPFRVVRHLPRWLRHFVYFLKLWKAALRADIVYAQDTVSVGFPALCAAKFSGRKFLIRVPGDYAWEQSSQQFGVKDSINDFQKKTYGFRVELIRRIQKFTVAHADLVITPSLYFRDLVREWVTQKDKVITIYNGVDFEELGLSQNAVCEPQTLITAGRLVPWKGFGDLVRLMAHMSEWKLYIAGDGPLRNELEKQIHDLRVEDRVMLLGSLPRQELMKRVQESEIFILNTYFESFSYQIVEVMRTKTPIITTNVGNLSEIIEDKKEGILVEPGNLEQIKSAIYMIHNDSGLRNAYTAHAYEKSNKFTIAHTLEKTARAINSLL